jgi:hypothetical protein
MDVLSAWWEWPEILGLLRWKRCDARKPDRFIVKDNSTYTIAVLEPDDVRQATRLVEKSLTRYPNEMHGSPLLHAVLMWLREIDKTGAVEGRGAVQGVGNVLRRTAKHFWSKAGPYMTWECFCPASAIVWCDRDLDCRAR